MKILVTHKQLFFDGKGVAREAKAGSVIDVADRLANRMIERGHAQRVLAALEDFRDPPIVLDVLIGRPGEGSHVLDVLDDNERDVLD